MERHGRQPLAWTLVVSLMLALGASPSFASVIRIDFVSGEISGSLAFVESPFIPSAINPDQVGYYYTTAALTFGPAGTSPSVSIPWQNATITVQNDLNVATTRVYSDLDEIKVASTGPIADYRFDFSQFFNAPSIGFLKTLSLSDPLPEFFPIVCPSQTIPCRDGQAPLNSGTYYSWTFDGTRRGIDVAGASKDDTIPEPGIAALMGVGLCSLIGWRRRRQSQRRL